MTQDVCSHDAAEIKQLLNRDHIPKHVAIIMDGNRRWAQRKKIPLDRGHWQGAETLMTIVEGAWEVGVEVLTVYAFSTENWKRPRKEVQTLMEVFKSYLIKMLPDMVKNGVRLETIGDIERFPEDVRDAIEKAKRETRECEKITLVLALNYGGRSEVTRAVKKILSDFALCKVTEEEINEDTFASYLDTSKYSDPELLIRTSGESRVSNFLLWQISYAEMYITKTLWPDFTKEDFYQALYDYQKRERRVGV